MSAGQDLMRRVVDAFVDFRLADPAGPYPHPGDVAWWLRDPSLEDLAAWCFWQREGHDVAVALAADDQLSVFVHPEAADLRDPARKWALEQLRKLAREDGAASITMQEEVGDDDPATIQRLEAEGWKRGSWYYLRQRLTLDGPLPDPQLPEGYTIRSVTGPEELGPRSALHRDSFQPFSSKTYEAAATGYGRAMAMPQYDPALDLMVVAPDGALAAGAIFWYDERLRAGLVEPLGTHPDHRRKGLAKALLLAGLRLLAERGATLVDATTNHPGTSELPIEHTSSRHIFEDVGFQIHRRVYRYLREEQL